MRMTQTRRSRPALTLASCSNASNLWGLSAQSLSIRLGTNVGIQLSRRKKEKWVFAQWAWQKNPALKCLWHGGLTIAMVWMKGYWPWNLIFFFWPCSLISQFAPTTVAWFGACDLNQSWKCRRHWPWIVCAVAGEISIFCLMTLNINILSNDPLGCLLRWQEGSWECTKDSRGRTSYPVSGSSSRGILCNCAIVQRMVAFLPLRAILY